MPRPHPQKEGKGLAEMNQVQDVATVFVPRLKLTVTLVSVQQAITQSVKEFGYDQPIDDQAEALKKFVSDRDLAIHISAHWEQPKCLRFFSIQQFPILFSGFFY